MLWSLNIDVSKISGSSNHGLPWPEAKSGEVHKSLVAYCMLLDAKQKPRTLLQLKGFWMYSQGFSTGLSLGSYMQNRGIADGRTGKQSAVTLNISKSCVDTVAAKISKNKVKVTVVTDRADFSMQRKAEKLDRAVFGLMADGNFRQVAKDVFRDCEIAGTGIVKTYPITSQMGKVRYERILPWEVLCDETDGIYGAPNKLHQYKVTSRASLLKSSKWSKTALEAIKRATAVHIGDGASAVDSIVVFEGWDLETGRHVICVETGDLIDETIENLEFPFSFIRWTRPVTGFWGNSLVDEISNIQIEINKNLYFVSQAMHLGHAPKWMLPNGCNVPKNYLNNEIGQIIPITGPNMPQYIAPSPISPQVLDYIQYLTNQAYAIAGVSQLSAQSIKPAGITAGIALTTMNDIESERFILAGQAFEELYVDVFKKTIVAAKYISENNPNFEITSSNPNVGLERLVWSEVDMEMDKFQVKPFPTSALPQTPEGRLQRLNDWVQLGLIGQDDVMELADFPDLQEFRELNKSPSISAKELVAAIIESSEVIQPSKFDDIQLCAKVATQQYLNLRNRKAPEDVLAALSEFIDICISMLPPPVAAAPEAPAAVEGAGVVKLGQ